MRTEVTLVDYGIGNFLNVVRALTSAGASVRVVEKASDAPAEIERMVLPGVGAFAGGMKEMRERGLDELVLNFAGTQRPFLGICVGMQMLFDASEEFGEHSGLGLIAGRVKPVPAVGAGGKPHCVPHIGWASLAEPVGGASWSQSVLVSTPANTPVYFVHSFHCQPNQPSHLLATADYDGQAICAAVQRDNLFGTQFHPERSAEAGLEVLRAFLRF